MTENQNLEFNILGCSIRVKADDNDNIEAKNSVNLVMQEIESLREQNPGLKDVELGVLSALKLASKSLEVEKDFKDNIFSMKTEVEGIIDLVESNGTHSSQSHL